MTKATRPRPAHPVPAAVRHGRRARAEETQSTLVGTVQRRVRDTWELMDGTAREFAGAVALVAMDSCLPSPEPGLTPLAWGGGAVASVFGRALSLAIPRTEKALGGVACGCPGELPFVTTDVFGTENIPGWFAAQVAATDACRAGTGAAPAMTARVIFLAYSASILVAMSWAESRLGPRAPGERLGAMCEQLAGIALFAVAAAEWSILTDLELGTCGPFAALPLRGTPAALTALSAAYLSSLCEAPGTEREMAAVGLPDGTASWGSVATRVTLLLPLAVMQQQMRGAFQAHGDRVEGAEFSFLQLGSVLVGVSHLSRTSAIVGQAVRRVHQGASAVETGLHVASAVLGSVSACTSWSALDSAYAAGAAHDPAEGLAALNEAAWYTGASVLSMAGASVAHWLAQRQALTDVRSFAPSLTTRILSWLPRGR